MNMVIPGAIALGLTVVLALSLPNSFAAADEPEERNARARALLASIQEHPGLQAWLDDRIEALLARDAKARRARIGVALLDLAPGRAPRLAHLEGHRPVYPASVVKFVYLMAAYAWQEQGRITIGRELDGQLTAMIYKSSNRATQEVFQALTGTQAGPELRGGEYRDFRDRRLAVKRWLAELGIEGLHTIHPTYDGGGDLHGRDVQLLRDPTMTGGIGNADGSFVNRQAMTPVATAELLALLAADLALNPPDSEAVRHRMQRDPRKQPYQRRRIAGGAMLTPGVEVYSKSGTWGPIFADAGIIRGPSGRQFVLAVFVESRPGYRGGFVAELADACARCLLGAEAASGAAPAGCPPLSGSGGPRPQQTRGGNEDS